MKEVLCFDVDNTLIRSDVAHIKALNIAFSEYGLPTKKEKDIEKLLNGTPSAKIIKHFFPKLSHEKVMQVRALYKKDLVNKTARFTSAITKNVTRTIKILEKDYKLVLVSNSASPEIIKMMENSGFNMKSFSFISGSDKVKHTKPAPDSIILVGKVMKRKPLFMIGDSILDIRAGKRAKVSTIAVMTGKFHPSKIIAEKPDFVIKTIDALPELLKKIKAKK